MEIWGTKISYYIKHFALIFIHRHLTLLVEKNYSISRLFCASDFASAAKRILEIFYFDNFMRQHLLCSASRSLALI